MRYVKTYESFLNESAGNKVFYHGGGKTLRQQDLKSEVMYFTDDLQQATSYSTERHQSSTAAITKAKLSMKKPITDFTVLEVIAKKLGINPDNYSAAEIIEQPKVISELTKLGYDSAILPDFGFVSDFDEFDAYVVFDAKKQVKIVQ
jgi:hypothetical protein